MAKKTRKKTEPVTPRPTDAELAERMRGTRGLCLVKNGGVWLDPVTGAVGTREDLEQAWLAEVAQ